MPTVYEQMGRLGKSVDANTAITEKLDGKLTKWRRLTIAAGIVAAVAIVAALVSYVSSVRAHDAVDAANRERDERSLSACVQFNVQQAQDRTSAIKTAIAGILVFARDPEHLTPVEQAALDDFTRRTTVTVEAEQPFRDCSPAGLAAYFRNPPVDPATR